MSEDATSAGLQQGDSTSKPLPVRKVKSTKSCNVCGRGFIKLAHLIRHVRTHGDERPFSCSKCDKAFARTDALQRHERAVHAANDSREVDEMEMPAEQGLGDGKEAANPDRIPRKRKRSSAGGERGGPQPSGSETGSTPRGQVDENSIFHPDFSHLFGLDHLQAGQKAHGQQQPPSASAPLATTSNSVTEQTSSGDAVSSALGVPGKKHCDAYAT